MNKIKAVIFVLIGIFTCNSCTVKYSMTGGSLSPGVKTYSVDYFPNKALLVVPYLSSLFTEKLTTYMRQKTGLTQLTDNNGDIRFEGQIVGYSQKPDHRNPGKVHRHQGRYERFRFPVLTI